MLEDLKELRSILDRFIAKDKHFNEPMDGIVYGVVASLGFATYENYDYVFRLGDEYGLARIEMGETIIKQLTGFELGRVRDMDGTAKIEVALNKNERIELRDFQLERYPGSQSPSSFAAEVTVKDGSLNKDHSLELLNQLNFPFIKKGDN